MKNGGELARLFVVTALAGVVVMLICIFLGQMSGSAGYPIPSIAGQVAGVMAATFVAYLSALPDPEEGGQEGKRPTGLFVFANAVSGLSVPFSAALSSLLNWNLSGTIESGILYVYLENFSQEYWIVPALAFLVLSSIYLCKRGARAIRDRSETSFRIRFFSFFLLFANATLLSEPSSENLTAFTLEGGGSVRGLLTMSIVLLVLSAGLTVLSSFASEISNIRIRVRHRDFSVPIFVMEVLFGLLACLALYLFASFLVERIGATGTGYADPGSRHVHPFSDTPVVLDILCMFVVLAIYGAYIAVQARFNSMVWTAQLFRTGLMPVIALLRFVSVPMAIVFASHLPFAMSDTVKNVPNPAARPLGIATDLAILAQPLPPLLETGRPDPLPPLDWRDFDIVCDGATGWKYESDRDVAFPLDECRLSMANGDVSSARVVLGVVFSSMGTTMLGSVDNRIVTERVL